MSFKTVALFSILNFAIDRVRCDCFTRDGTAAKDSRYYNGPELVACGRGSNTCCLPGQKCGSNLLCSTRSTLTREYCANKEWQGCSALGAEILPYGITLNECGPNRVCYNSTECCTNGGTIFYINPTTGEVKDVKQADNIDSASATFWDASESTTSSPSPASSTAASQTTSISSLFSPSSALSSASVSASSTPDESQKPSKISSGSVAGIVVGCIAGVAVLLALGLIFLRKKRNARAGVSSHVLNEADTYQYHDTKPETRAEIYQLSHDEPPKELANNTKKVHEMP